MKKISSDNSIILNFFRDKKLQSDSQGEEVSLKSKQRLEKLILKMRTGFARKNEKSPVAKFLVFLYYSFLNCPLSVAATFLAMFSITVFGLHFLMSESWSNYLLSGNGIYAVLMFVTSLFFIPVKRSISTLFSQSVFLSDFQISYDRSLYTEYENTERAYSSYSSSIFLGIICGIFSIIYPTIYILAFIIMIISCIIIINRPESGIPAIIFAAAFMSDKYAVLLVFVTLVSLIYKYLQGKRHIAFDLDELLLFLCALIFLLAGIYTVSGNVALKEAFKLISAVIVFICTKNLIKSTSALKCCVRMLSGTGFYISVIIVIKYLLVQFLSQSSYTMLCNIRFISYILTDFTDGIFIPVFIAATLPINLALVFGKFAGVEKFKCTLIVSVQMSSLLLYGNHRLLTAAVTACIIILSFRKFLSVLVLPVVPLLSKMLTSVLSIIINPSFISALPSEGYSIFDKTVDTIIKEHLNFGIGLGKENMSYILSDYAYPGVDKYIRPHSTIKSMLLCFGFIATIFIIITIARLLIKNIKTAIISRGKNPICESVSVASVSSCISIGIISLCFFITDVASAIIIFALICGLGSSAAQCMESEYIDSNRIR